MKQDAQKAKRDAVDSAWERATELFANSKAMRPRLSWLTGVSMDITADRIQRLLRQPRTAALYKALDVLDVVGLQRFLQCAEINLERAAAAMRLNLVVNISVPVGALVIVNQLFPQVVSNFVADYGTDAVIAGSISILFLLLLSIWYSYCCVTQARDLAHLTRPHASRHFNKTGAPHNFNPAQL